MRVFLVDDHALFRSGVRAELDRSVPDVTVVGEAGSVAEAVAGIAHLRPDVVLLDVHMPDGGGAEVLRKVRPAQPDVVFLALSVSDAAEDVIAVIRAGARGYVTKTISGRELADAVRRVRAGDPVFSPRLAGFVLDAFSDRPGAAPPTDPELDRLTRRERDVLRLLARGYSYREIAGELFISVKTVETHVSSVLRKTAAVEPLRALALGVGPPPGLREHLTDRAERPPCPSGRRQPGYAAAGASGLLSARVSVRRLRADDPQRCGTRLGRRFGVVERGDDAQRLRRWLRLRRCQRSRSSPPPRVDVGRGKEPPRQGRASVAARFGEPVTCTGTTFVRTPAASAAACSVGAGRLGRDDRQRQGRRVHQRGLRRGPRPGWRSPQDQPAEPHLRCRWRPAPQAW